MNPRSQSVFDILRESIQEILPDVPADRIRREARLDELGADSVDRAEIFSAALRRLELKVPLTDLARANDLSEVIAILGASH
jgi:polyketide biosynthesis acyl carrier protein